MLLELDCFAELLLDCATELLLDVAELLLELDCFAELEDFAELLLDFSPLSLL